MANQKPIIDCTRKNGITFQAENHYNRSDRSEITKYMTGWNVKTPESGHILAPWVAIDFVDQFQQPGADASITVGNQSSASTDPKNCAVIKSFEFGHSDGVTARVTVQDSQGGNFEEFMKRLIQHWACFTQENIKTLLLRIQFGWVRSNVGTYVSASRSPCYYLHCDSIESSYSEGKITFEITAKDLVFAMLEGSTNSDQGNEAGTEPVRLTKAIQTLMCDGDNPNIAEIEFRIDGATYNSSNNQNSNQNGPIELFQGVTQDDRVFGPLGRWNTMGQNKLAAVTRWLQEHPSKNKKGWVPRYDFTVPGGKLVFWEDTLPDCDILGDNFWDAGSIGTYIVNAGKSSPVIEFNPKISWRYGSTVVSNGGRIGDTNINSMGTDGAKNPGHECLPADQVKGAGSLHTTTPSDTFKEIHGERADKEAAQNDAIAAKAIDIDHYGDVQADLVIIGDPTLIPTLKSRLSNVSIVVVNPFNISVENDKLEWLAKPQCNPVLSNKAWIVQSVTHKIDSGNYTTMIGVKLAAPGIKLPPGSPLGGWTGGWKPTTCPA